MAERPEGYGFTAEIQGKIADKYDTNLEREAREWINHYVPDSGLTGVSGSDATHEKLKDGVILCKLALALSPGCIRNINNSKMAFKMMENIGNFLGFCESYGVAKTDLFQTVDLYEATNMPAVINGIHSLGRKAGSKGKYGIGPKESDQNKRQFSESQIRAGRDGHIGLQAGTNKFANQSGQNFGKTRAIID